MNKLLSIIIPCFNSETTIQETLESLEGNDRALFEVILIDDGSIDSTVSVAKQYAAKSSLDLKIFTQSNQGVSAARNLGIERASGKYILFLDSDDLMAENFVNEIGAVLKTNDYDTAACYRTSKIKKVVPIKNVAKRANDCTPSSLLEEYTYSKQRLGFTSFCYKKAIIDDAGIRFFWGSKYGEDFEFATKYLANCRSATRVDCYHYYYRNAKNSVSKTVRYSQVDSVFSAKRAEEYLKEMGNPFYGDFRDYMVNRAIFSCAHRFSKGNNRELFDRLHEDFDVKKAIIALKHNKHTDFKTKLACCLYLMSKSLFFCFCRF